MIKQKKLKTRVSVYYCFLIPFLLLMAIVGLLDVSRAAKLVVMSLILVIGIVVSVLFSRTLLRSIDEPIKNHVRQIQDLLEENILIESSEDAKDQTDSI